MYKVYEIKQRVFADNDLEADKVRTELKKDKTFLLNLMSSPGAGKTTTIPNPNPEEPSQSPRKKPKAKNMNKMAKNAKNNNIKPYERTAMTLPVLSYVLNFRSSSFNST